MKCASTYLVLSALLWHPGSLGAQTRGFLVRLGADTFAVERIRRDGNAVEGAVVRHTPTTTVLRYSITFRPDSSIAVYEESIANADGTPVAPSAQGVAQIGMKMTFVDDSVIREVTQNGMPVVKRDAAPRVTLPMVGGTSPYWQELALQAVKRSGGAQIGAYGFGLGQTSPNMFPVQFVGGDSAEIMLGQGFRRGYRLDRAGQLVHGDASNTTVRLQMTPIRDADIDAIARAWAAKDAVGQGMGLASSRDTASATLDGARIWIDYGRPAKRGRTIWGTLVPFEIFVRVELRISQRSSTRTKISILAESPCPQARTVCGWCRALDSRICS